MKQLFRFICLILVVSLVFALPTSASANATTYASAYFNVYCTHLYRTSSTTFQVWFDVTGTGIMSKLGVSTIVLERYNSSSGDWDALHTYHMEDYPEMICENTASHVGHINCSGSSRHEYRAYVTFYAEKGAGFGERSIYAYFL